MIQAGTRVIKFGAFEGNATLQEIVIPDSVTVIEGAAFRNCTALQKVVLPANLKEINESVFEGCTSLSEIVLPDTVTLIKRHAFAGCSSLERMELPEKMFLVEPDAFQNAACEGKVVYKRCMRLHGNTMFSKKDRQKHIEIPEGVIALEKRCFKDYTDLETIKFPETLKFICFECFSGCTGLREIHLPEGICIEDKAFEGCTSLKTLDIPENSRVGEGAFQSCLNLTSLRLSHKANLGWTTFLYCASLAEVYAPEDADYFQTYRRLPETCRILNLDGKDISQKRFKISVWEGELPEETLPEIAKLQGVALGEQLDRCCILTEEVCETSSYGETDSKTSHVSRIRLKKYSDLESLLVKDGTIVGFIDLKHREYFLGQVCKSYSDIDSDGTGSTYTYSASRLTVPEK